MLSNFIKFFGGDPHKKEIEKLAGLVDEINALEADYEKLSDEALKARTAEFRAELARELDGIDETEERQKVEQEALDTLLPQAFAAVREASKRTIGLRHYDVQLIGGTALHRKTIAEMRTGEGKTLVATLPLYLNALTGRGVHLVTVNDYLARRDARWMGAIFHALGMSVGVLQMAAATENGQKAFLVDFERESPHEDQHHLRMVPRVEAYKADITYGTNSEFGFDYLRDNMTMRLDDRVQRGHYYAIVDEVDNVLIDEARTPLIISGPAQGDLEWYGKMAIIVRQLQPEDYEVSEKDRTVVLTEIGMAHVEQLLGQPLSDPDRPEDITPEQARLMGYLEQAMRAQHLFKRNKDYLVQAGKVVIVDEFTGRLMPGRRWSDGLHQAVEAKEGVKVEPENVTYATITLQNYFRMYQKLAGMTGTALTEAEEFSKIYNLEVLPIPTNLEYRAFGEGATLIQRKAKDEEGYEYTFYVNQDDPADASPVLWKRKDYPDVIFRTYEAKLRAIVLEIVRYHVMGRPMLVGTTSVENSEMLSERLRAEAVRRLVQVLLVKRAWMKANDRVEDGRLIPELVPFNVQLEKVDPSALRQFVRPLNISINVEEPENLAILCDLLNLPAGSEERLKAVLQGGVPHQVLNARKHTEESQIIAGAGAFGALTIATNMAGRGVDIKLGGELPEDTIAVVNRVLQKAGVEDPYNLRMEDRRAALQKLSPDEWGIYETDVHAFLQYFDDMERVRALGGLHVIGSERHEARRIDNQLRGRAARQGDPGSSRFYLSLEDELMRMFGGEQVSNLMTRLAVDDSLPLEMRVVSNLIEQSQHRVEGANFDVRKHLLEYDDVLNKQRAQVYAQRDRVFVKDDLSEDVDGLLMAEIEKRVPAALQDPEGPWKLLAWLEGLQPAFAYGENDVFPSFSFRLLLEEIDDANLKSDILEVVRESVTAEQDHVMRAIETAVNNTGETIEKQIEERNDAMDTFFQGLRDAEEQRRPQELLDELSSLLRIQVRMTNDQLRQLVNDPDSVEKELRKNIPQVLSQINAMRTIGAIEHRLGETLDIDKISLQKLEWNEIAGKVLDAAQAVLEKQSERLTGPGGQVVRDLETLLARDPNPDVSGLIRLLTSIQQGTRTAFDSKTHRQVRQNYVRFSYSHYASGLLEGRDAKGLIQEVSDHLDEARTVLIEAWGQGEFGRLSQNAVLVRDLGPASAILGADRADQPVTGLGESDRNLLIGAIGRHTMNQIYRQLLLSAISELWVDYLTRVEALRVSIGLEAYAQRDPLVQYKSKASEMFQTLLEDIRSAVISRVFAYQPRRWSAAPVESAEASGPQQAPARGTGPDESAKKKKRHRH
jgi:preprotein translocase subunit SecA